MEVIRYWKIVYKRWWLPAALIVVVAVVSLATYKKPQQMYTTSFRINVGMEPVPRAGAQYTDNPLDTWMASEYLMDDLASAVRGADYARRVAQRLDEGGELNRSEVNLAGRFGSSTEHRVLAVSILWHDPDQLARIANAAVAVLQEDAAELVGPLGQSVPVLRLIDPPAVAPVGRSLKDKLDLPIRFGLALLAGVAGAFLLDYLDTTVSGREQVEALGIHVLAEIGRQKMRRRQ